MADVASQGAIEGELPDVRAVTTIDAGVLNVGYAEAALPTAGRDPAPRLALRHPQLRRRRAGARRGGLPGDRALSARLRHDALPVGRTFRNGQQSALAVDVVALMDALGIERAILAGFDWGARTADIVAALWPERCTGLVSVSGYLIGSQAAERRPLPPEARAPMVVPVLLRHRTRPRRLRRNTGTTSRSSSGGSPRRSGTSTTPRSTAARRRSTTPTTSTIVIHNYRWRLGLAEGEPQYDDLEQRLAAAPVITVPTITLEGDANGAPHPDPGAYARRFSGSYQHRTIERRDRPQPAPGSPGSLQPGSSRRPPKTTSASQGAFMSDTNSDMPP